MVELIDWVGLLTTTPGLPVSPRSPIGPCGPWNRNNNNMNWYKIFRKKKLSHLQNKMHITLMYHIFLEEQFRVKNLE